MKITLHNNFHNTACTLKVADVRSHIHNVATAYPTASQIKKAKKLLCGVAGCTCSDDAGTRGPQALDNGKRLELNLDAIYCAAR